MYLQFSRFFFAPFCNCSLWCSALATRFWVLVPVWRLIFWEWFHCGEWHRENFSSPATNSRFALFEQKYNGACAHYVMVSKFQWKPFWLATQRDPQNDWTATQNRVNYDVFAQAPFSGERTNLPGIRHLPPSKYWPDHFPRPIDLSCASVSMKAWKMIARYFFGCKQ